MDTFMSIAGMREGAEDSGSGAGTGNGVGTACKRTGTGAFPHKRDSDLYRLNHAEGRGGLHGG